MLDAMHRVIEVGDRPPEQQVAHRAADQPRPVGSQPTDRLQQLALVIWEALEHQALGWKSS